MPLCPSYSSSSSSSLHPLLLRADALDATTQRLADAVDAISGAPSRPGVFYGAGVRPGPVFGTDAAFARLAVVLEAEGASAVEKFQDESLPGQTFPFMAEYFRFLSGFHRRFASAVDAAVTTPLRRFRRDRRDLEETLQRFRSAAQRVDAVEKRREEARRRTTARGRRGGAAGENVAAESRRKLESIVIEADDVRREAEAEKESAIAALQRFVAGETLLPSILLKLLLHHRKWFVDAIAEVDGVVGVVDGKIEGFGFKRRFGTKLQEHTRTNELGHEVSPVIEDCCSALKQIGLEEEGVLRVPGRVSKVKCLVTAFDFPGAIDWRRFRGDVHAIGDAFKSYLRQLPQPLVDWQRFEPLMQEDARRRRRLLRKTARTRSADERVGKRGSTGAGWRDSSSSSAAEVAEDFAESVVAGVAVDCGVDLRKELRMEETREEPPDPFHTLDATLLRAINHSLYATPTVARVNLAYVVDLLSAILDRSSVNKMTAEGLGLIMGHNLTRGCGLGGVGGGAGSSGIGVASQIGAVSSRSGDVVRFVKILIENRDFLFPNFRPKTRRIFEDNVDDDDDDKKNNNNNKKNKNNDIGNNNKKQNKNNQTNNRRNDSSGGRNSNENSSGSSKNNTNDSVKPAPKTSGVIKNATPKITASKSFSGAPGALSFTKPGVVPFTGVGVGLRRNSSDPSSAKKLMDRIRPTIRRWNTVSALTVKCDGAIEVDNRGVSGKVEEKVSSLEPFGIAGALVGVVKTAGVLGVAGEPGAAAAAVGAAAAAAGPVAMSTKTSRDSPVPRFSRSRSLKDRFHFRSNRSKDRFLEKTDRCQDKRNDRSNDRFLEKTDRCQDKGNDRSNDRFLEKTDRCQDKGNDRSNDRFQEKTDHCQDKGNDRSNDRFQEKTDRCQDKRKDRSNDRFQEKTDRCQDKRNDRFKVRNHSTDSILDSKGEPFFDERALSMPEASMTSLTLSLPSSPSPSLPSSPSQSLPSPSLLFPSLSSSSSKSERLVGAGRKISANLYFRSELGRKFLPGEGDKK